MKMKNHEYTPSTLSADMTQFPYPLLNDPDVLYIFVSMPFMYY